MAMEIFKLMGTVAISKDKALKDIKAIQDQAQKASTAMGKSFTKFSGYIEKHSDQIKKAGKYMTVFGGIATAAFVLSVKSAASFEEQLANVSTMLDESAMKILPEYRKGLQSLSVEFGESTETLSKGLYDILSASIPPAEAMYVLEVSAKAAAAGLTDTGVAADAVTTILNSYGFEAEDAGRVSDVLFAIVKEGKTTFAELAPSIGKVAATASMAGLDFEDLGASIATLTRAGIRTEEAMTAINGVLIAFLKPTDEAVEAAKEFGLELNTNTLRTLGMTGVMEKLTNATAEQLAAIFPNIRGLKGMAAALGDTEGYAKSYALMLDSAGLTQEAFAKQSATLNFALKQLKSMFEILKVTVGDALAPAVKDITEKVMGVLKKVKEWTEANKPLTETIVKWAAGIGVALLVLGPLLVMLPGIVTGFGLLFGHFTAFVATGALIAVVAGVIKLANYLKETVGGMREFREELDKMTVAQIDAEIKSLETTVEGLLEKLNKIPEKGGLFGIFKREDTEAGQVILTMLNELYERIDMLKKKREELTGVEKEGVELTEEEIAARKKLDEQIAEFEDSIKGLTESEIKLLEGSEKLSGQMKILTAEYELTNKIIEDTNKYYQGMLELSEELVKELELEKEKTKEGTKERQESVLALLSAQKGVKDLKEAIAELTIVEKLELEGLDLISAKLSVLEEKYKVIEKGVGYYKEKLQLLKEEHAILVKNLDEVIKKYGEGTAEYYKALTAIIANENEMKNWWKEIDKGGETVDEFATSFADKMLMAKVVAENFGVAAKTAWENWKEFFDNMRENAQTTTEILMDAAMRWADAVGGAFENAITSLLNWKEINEQVQADLAANEEARLDERAEYNENYKKKLIGMLEGIVDANILKNASIEELEALMMTHLKDEWTLMSTDAIDDLQDIDDKYGDLKTGIEEDQVTLASIWKDFWEELSRVAIAELAKVIAQQAISVLLSWGWAGWLLLGLAFIYSLVQSWGKALGGEVTKQAMALGGKIAGYDLGGKIKEMKLAQAGMEYFQRGGPKGTDTVPIWVTPGEYVISKPMTDFIKRTGIVTSDLISSIRMGGRTPIPAFARGGLVGPGIGSSIELNIMPGAISIFAQELNDETIANAGDKIFVELRKQFSMRGLALVED